MYSSVINEVLALDQSSNLTSEVEYPTSFIADSVDSECSLCPLTHLRLLNADDSSAYTGGEVALDPASNKMIVQTATPFSQLSLLLEAYMDPATQPDCQFITS